MGPTTGILRRNPPPLIKDYDADIYAEDMMFSCWPYRALSGERAAFVLFIHCTALALRQGKASGGLAAAEVDATAQPALGLECFFLQHFASGAHLPAFPS